MEKEKLVKLISEVANVDIDHLCDLEDIIFDYYLESEMFTEEELKLVTKLNGYSLETLNDILYIRFGYRDLQQMLGEY